MRLLIALVGMGVVVSAQAMAAGLFGMVEIKANRIDSIPKWVDVLERTSSEDLYDRCNLGDSACKGRRPGWFAMVQRARGMTPEEQMRAVNSWVNNHPYITDDQLWGKSDYWETPGQFVDRSGDCEDYAITKYYTLKSLGWDENDLRMAVVQDTVRNIPHAILAVRLGENSYILDNLATEPLLDRYVKQYTPYYAVNAYSRWVFIKPQ
ncbi:MAG: hypothetical protein GC129_02280 [Proteobacteria bacterium]|nr:hypothetical protein [Pseudomonadota bacterium]